MRVILSIIIILFSFYSFSSQGVGSGTAKLLQLLDDLEKLSSLVRLAPKAKYLCASISDKNEKKECELNNSPSPLENNKRKIGLFILLHADKYNCEPTNSLLQSEESLNIYIQDTEKKQSVTIETTTINEFTQFTKEKISWEIKEGNLETTFDIIRSNLNLITYEINLLGLHENEGEIKTNLIWNCKLSS